MWGATSAGTTSPALLVFQLTLPVWGATDVVAWFLEMVNISTHAPRVGSDTAGNPTITRLLISTHAPRVGSDKNVKITHIPVKNFNSRSPCGERQNGLNT